MITITDNRDHTVKQFKDIDEFDYFMCKDNLYMKIPDVMKYGHVLRAVRINDPKVIIYMEDDYPVEPVDLSIIIKSPKE
ncbi:MAG: hypothetical protein J6T10_32195 [Methanobrevibacter sp.]|nr:hypothetical protein [Methanobrevibacter sp.]